MRRRLAWALVLTAATALRLLGIESHGPYWDEVFQIHASVGSSPPHGITDAGASFSQQDFWSRNSLENVLAVANSTGDPPLFYVLLHYWIAVLGTDDVAVRLPSVIAGVVLVALLGYFAHIHIGRASGLWVAGFAAVHPLLVQYSQEARGRMLAATLIVASTLAFVTFVTQPAHRPLIAGCAYGGLVVSALMTHYMVLPVVICHGIWAVLRFRSARQWRAAMTGWLAAGIVLLLWMTAGGGFRGLETHRRTSALWESWVAEGRKPPYFAQPATPRFIGATTIHVWLAMSGADVQSLALKSGIQIRHLAPIAIIPVVVLVVGWSTVPKDGRSVFSLLIGVLLVATAAWVASAIQLGHTMPIRPHYAALVAPHLVVALGAGLSGCARRARERHPAWLLPILAMAALGVLAHRSARNDPMWQIPVNTYRRLAHQIQAQARPGDEVVYPRWLDARTVNLYLRREPPLPQRVVPEPGYEAGVQTRDLVSNSPYARGTPPPPPAQPIRVIDPSGVERTRFETPRLF